MRATWKLSGLCVLTGFLFWGEALAAGPTIDEVWMRHGGARLYYDALMEPTQMELKGARRKDPALIRSLPPITEAKAQQPRRRSSRPAAGASAAAGKPAAPVSTGLPAGQATSAKPAVDKPAATQGAAGGQGTAPANGSLAMPQNKDAVFVPPPVPNAGAGGTAASVGASTSSRGNNGTTAASGTTGAAGQGGRVPAGARP